MRQHGQEQRWRARQEADAITGDACQHRVAVKHLLGIDRGALDEGGDPAGLVTKGVKEGVDDQVAVTGTQPDHPAPGAEGANGGAVRRHHTLGPPGGARGEHQVGSAVGREGLLTRSHLRGRDDTAPAHEVAPAHVARQRRVGLETVAQHHHMPQARRALAVKQRRVVLTQEVADAEHQPGAAALQDVGRLGTFHAGIQRDQHRAGGVNAAGRQDPFVQVGRPDRHAVARRHAQRDQ